jgi:hypothetical protein
MTLTVTIAGSGSVVTIPAGISCTSGTCTADLAVNAVYLLSPTPAAGWTFAGWSGACSGDTPCTLTMSAARNVTATFEVGGPAPPSTPGTPSLGLGRRRPLTTSPEGRAARRQAGAINGTDSTSNGTTGQPAAGGGLPGLQDPSLASDTSGRRRPPTAGAEGLATPRGKAQQTGTPGSGAPSTTQAAPASAAGLSLTALAASRGQGKAAFDDQLVRDVLAWWLTNDPEGLKALVAQASDQPSDDWSIELVEDAGQLVIIWRELVRGYWHTVVVSAR